MLTRKALEHFGDKYKLADALSISRQAVEQWGEYVPEGTAYKLQVMTAGVLRVDPLAYHKVHRQAAGAI